MRLKWLSSDIHSLDPRLLPRKWTNVLHVSFTAVIFWCNMRTFLCPPCLMPFFLTSRSKADKWIDLCWIVGAVQGVYADIHVHYIRGEVQGTCGGEAPESRRICLFPSSEEVIFLLRQKKLVSRTCKKSVASVEFNGLKRFRWACELYFSYVFL